MRIVHKVDVLWRGIMLKRSPNRNKPYKALTSKGAYRTPKPMRVRGASTRAKQVASWHKELHAEWQLKGITICEATNGWTMC